MRFSLIVGTLNRTNSLKYCIESLLRQQYTKFEIIVIDQSDDNETENYVSTINDERIIYKHVSFKGLSKARNEGIRFSSGDYICLIDDDAVYEDDFLTKSVHYIESFDNKAIYSGYIYNTLTDAGFAKYRDSNEGKKLSLKYILHTCPSAGLVIPAGVFDDCGLFDESFGVGACFGAGEETDLLLRAIQKGYAVIYAKEICLKHPYPVTESSSTLDEKACKMRKYYMGIGALYRKHIFELKNYRLMFSFVYLWIKFAIKYVLFFRFNHSVVKEEARGYHSGFINYSKLVNIEND